MEEVLRRLAYVDGNAVDPEGGALGRAQATLREHSLVIRKITYLFWIMVGLCLGGNVTIIKLLADVLARTPK